MMPESPNVLLTAAKPWSLYYSLFQDILRSFKRRCCYFYGLEMVSLVSQLTIALVFLLLFRKLGIEETGATPSAAGGYRAVLSSWAQVFSMNQILMLLIACLAINAIASFTATRIINRVGRDYEDLNVHKAFEIFSKLSLSDFIEINKLFPFDDRSAVALIQSDVRMTAISARQLVRGSFSIVLIVVLLGIFSLIDIRFFWGMLAFFVLSILPMAYFFRAGMIHSFELLGYAPLMTKAKRALFQKAISKGRKFNAEDAEFLAAYDNENGRIKKYMDEFEYRFQLINNGALTFDGLAKAATILAVFGAVILVGMGQIDYSLFIFVILVMNLSISAFKGVMAVTSSISRYFVHVVKFRLFLETCERTQDDEEGSSVSPYHRSSLPDNYPLLFEVKQQDVDIRSLDRGGVYAFLMTGPVNKLRTFSIYQHLLQTPEVYGWVLNNAGYINDNVEPNTANLVNFFDIELPILSKYFDDFSDRLRRVVGPSEKIPTSADDDWSQFLQKDSHQIAVKILGHYTFTGKILFVNAELVVVLNEDMRKQLFAELTDGLTLLFDRRAKPNLSSLKDFYKTVILFDGSTTTMMTQDRLYTMTHTEIMGYIKKPAQDTKAGVLSMVDDSEFAEAG